MLMVLFLQLTKLGKFEKRFPHITEIYFLAFQINITIFAF